MGRTVMTLERARAGFTVQPQAASGPQTKSSLPNSLYVRATLDYMLCNLGSLARNATFADTLDNNVAVQQLTKKAQKGQARNTVLRKGAGEVWEDPTLMEWDPAHFRLFIGDLGNDVNEDNLIKAFGPEKGWMSFVKAKVVRDKVTNKTRGYGFVSYVDPDDFMKAWKAMDGKYVGSRPIKIQKATTGVRRVDIGTKKARELDTKKKSAVIGNKACLTLRDLYNKLTLRYTGPRHSQSLWELETVRASLSKSSL